MNALTPKSWLTVVFLLGLAATGMVATVVHNWYLLAIVTLMMLLCCSLLLVTQTHRNMKINKPVIARLEDLSKSPDKSRSTALTQDLVTLYRRDIPWLKKRVADAERRLLSLNENAAYASEKSAYELSISIAQLEQQVEEIRRVLNTPGATKT